MLRLYRVAPDVTTLGPGNRFCIWTQGCQRRCPGCMSKDTWDADAGFLMEEEELVRSMLRFEFEGITISGGEPFDQCHALRKVVRSLKQKRDAGVVVYTGMKYETLLASEDPAVAELLSLVDLLIDGEYVAELDDDGAYRGSSNQRAFCLTDRYREWADAEIGKPGMRRQQIQIDDRGVLLIGLHPHS